MPACDRLKLTQQEPMRVTTVVHYVLPFLALVGGAMILLVPRLQNYVVAIYLMLVGVMGINSLFHFVRTCCCGAGCGRPAPRARIPEGGRARTETSQSSPPLPVDRRLRRREAMRDPLDAFPPCRRQSSAGAA